MSLKQSIFLDFRRHICEGNENTFRVIFLTQGFWASWNYRIARYLYVHARSALLRKIILRCYSVVLAWMEVITKISLPIQCEIGDGLFLSHFGTIIVNPSSRLGENCTLHQGVTIGVAGIGANRGAPIIGSRVYIGVNAVIIGKITVGDDAVIGAGAIVTKSIPPRGVAVGNPARVISSKGSFELVRYHDLENDAARTAAMDRAREPAEI